MLAINTPQQKQQQPNMKRAASCSVEAAAAEEIFGWSDLPVQGDYFLESQDFLLAVVEEPISPPDFLLEMEEQQEDEEEDLSFSWSSCPPSPCSVVEEIHCLSEKLQKACTIRKEGGKKVSFSNILQIRTHEVILGDHPFCRGGMALQLGWGHGESDELLNLDVHEELRVPRRMGELYLTFYERRERLQEMTGMTGAELLQAEYALCCSDPDKPAPAALHRTPRMSTC